MWYYFVSDVALPINLKCGIQDDLMNNDWQFYFTIIQNIEF